MVKRCEKCGHVNSKKYEKSYDERFKSGIRISTPINKEEEVCEICGGKQFIEELF